MRYLLAGPDDFSLKARLAEIKAGLGDPQILDTATNVFEGASVSPGEFRLVVNAMPFLAPVRLIIVKGLLSRFKKSEAAGKKKKTKENQDSDVLEMAEIIRNAPPSTVLVLIESELLKSNPLFKALETDLKTEDFPPPNKPRVKEWVGQRVNQAGGHITPPAINLLVQYIGTDLWTAAAEVEKLTLYADNRQITEEDVKLLVGNAQEASIFSLVDGIFEQRLKNAAAALESLKAGGVSSSYIITMIARQLKMVIQIKDLKGRGVKDTEIRRLLGLSNDFVWQKTLQQAGRQSIARFKEIFSRLLETDVAIKTGQLDEITAVDLLVAELASAG
ncbi:MAG: DNA polymerase III subunit delta [Dehalogenimonas sp.]|uniref:DNA polymerase III subunit delta n=1 Tax=Candidatus Dehalogenimonas loeffleri TaxID=3127115 RepID=A0ABZ2J8D0_9CHLR|nr:DNA polymerase III subunit delta [Dehalogenimonas sp.]